MEISWEDIQINLHCQLISSSKSKFVNYWRPCRPIMTFCVVHMSLNLSGKNHRIKSADISHSFLISLTYAVSVAARISLVSISTRATTIFSLLVNTVLHTDRSIKLLSGHWFQRSKVTCTKSGLDALLCYKIMMLRVSSHVSMVKAIECCPNCPVCGSQWDLYESFMLGKPY